MEKIDEYEEYDTLDYMDSGINIDILEEISKRRVPYEQRIKLIESKLGTGKCGFANGNKNRVTFKTTIDRTVRDEKKFYRRKSVNQDVDYLLIKAVVFLGIPGFMADRAKYMLAKTWNGIGQKQNFNKIKYELAALGCLMFCCYEDLHEGTMIDFTRYVKQLYPKDQIRIRTKQLFRAHKKVSELYMIMEKEVFDQNFVPQATEHLLSAETKKKLMENYRLNHAESENKGTQLNLGEVLNNRSLSTSQCLVNLMNG